MDGPPQEDMHWPQWDGTHGDPGSLYYFISRRLGRLPDIYFGGNGASLARRDAPGDGRQPVFHVSLFLRRRCNLNPECAGLDSDGRICQKL